MNGSRLGRGRMGRVALLAGGVTVVILLVFVYRSTSSEISRLKDVNAKCAQFQEDLSRRLREVYEYKDQMEKILANEKSANDVAKEELLLKDKHSSEALQRFNSLQQNYKMLQTEHQDLKENCQKRDDMAQENAKNFESRLDDLRMQLQQAAEDKEKSMEHLKTKYTQVVSAKELLEEQYESLRKATGNNNGEVERLQKQVIQLQRELDDVKKSPHFSVGGLKDGPQLQGRMAPNEGDPPAGVSKDSKADKLSGDNNQMQVIRPSSQQQVSRPSDEAGQNPQPLAAPENQWPADDNERNEIDDSPGNRRDGNSDRDDGALPNEPKSDVRFESRDGKVVPVGPNEVREQQNVMPVPEERDDEKPDAEQPKQVLVPPNDPPALVSKDAKKGKSLWKPELTSSRPAIVPIYDAN